MNKDKGNKRFHDEMTEMEIGAPSSSEIIKKSTTYQFVVDLDLEESINQDIQIGLGDMIQQEELEQNMLQQATSSFEQIVSQYVFEAHQSLDILDIQNYQYA